MRSTLKERPETMPADFTPRQREVLDEVLAILVEEGDAFSMAAVARRASCSKETLYKWFGDREGLLGATVQWQASRVGGAELAGGITDGEGLKRAILRFATDWLRVISTDRSVALNRVAITHAGSGKSNLGSIVLRNGRLAIGSRMKPVLEAARLAGLLRFEDAETAFRTLFGLVARDVQIRLLLGDKPDLTADAIARDAEAAYRAFMKIYGSRETLAKSGASK